MRKKWFLVAAGLLAVGLGYLVYSMFIHSSADYLTVSELKQQAESLSGQAVRVGGRVAPGSIDWDNEARVLRFTLTDDRESLTIVYEGVAPDNFKPGTELIMVGKYRPDATLDVLSFVTRRSVCNVCHA